MVLGIWFLSRSLNAHSLLRPQLANAFGIRLETHAHSPFALSFANQGLAELCEQCFPLGPSPRQAPELVGFEPFVDKILVEFVGAGSIGALDIELSGQFLCPAQPAAKGAHLAE